MGSAGSGEKVLQAMGFLNLVPIRGLPVCIPTWARASTSK